MDPDADCFDLSGVAASPKVMSGDSPAFANSDNSVFDESIGSINDCGSRKNGTGSSSINDVDDDLDESFDMLANYPTTPAGPPPGEIYPEFSVGGSVGSVERQLSTPERKSSHAASLSETSGDGEGLRTEEDLADLLGIQDSPPGACETDTLAAAAPISLRRSPRLAARTEALDADVNSNSLLKAIRKSGRVDKAGASSGDVSNGVTPYSSKRARRSSRAFSTFTPGSAFGSDGQDDANASFRTAIMGDASPANSANDPGSVLRSGALFSESGHEEDEGEHEGDINTDYPEELPLPPPPSNGTTANAMMPPSCNGDASSTAVEDLESPTATDTGAGGQMQEDDDDEEDENDKSSFTVQEPFDADYGLQVVVGDDDDDDLFNIEERMLGLKVDDGNDSAPEALSVVEPMDGCHIYGCDGVDGDGSTAGSTLKATGDIMLSDSTSPPRPPAPLLGSPSSPGGDVFDGNDYNRLPNTGDCPPSSSELSDFSPVKLEVKAGDESWLEPPSPAFAPLYTAGHKLSAPEEGGCAPLPKDDNSLLGGARETKMAVGVGAAGISPSSVLGLSGREDDAVMATEIYSDFAAVRSTDLGGGGNKPSAEELITRSKLPKVVENIFVSAAARQSPAATGAIEDGPGIAAAASCGDIGGDVYGSKEDVEPLFSIEDSLPEVGRGDGFDATTGSGKYFHESSAVFESSVILEEMLLDAGAGAAPGNVNVEKEKKSLTQETAAASNNQLQQQQGTHKKKPAVLSAVEKEAMALAAECVAEQKGIVLSGPPVVTVKTEENGKKAPATNRTVVASLSPRANGSSAAVSRGSKKSIAEIHSIKNGGGKTAAVVTSGKRVSLGRPGRRQSTAPSVSVAAMSRAPVKPAAITSAGVKETTTAKPTTVNNRNNSKNKIVSSRNGNTEKAAVGSDGLSAIDKSATGSTATTTYIQTTSSVTFPPPSAAAADSNSNSNDDGKAASGCNGGPSSVDHAAIGFAPVSKVIRGGRRGSTSARSSSVSGVGSATVAAADAQNRRGRSPSIRNSSSRRDSARLAGAASTANATASGTATGRAAAAMAARHQSMAFGSRVPGAARAGSPLKAKAPVVGVSAGTAVGMGARASVRSRARSSGARPRESFGFGRGRDSVNSAAGKAAAPAPAAAPVAVAPVAATSRLLAPTKVSQGRARPRSASPAVSSARGRVLVGGGCGAATAIGSEGTNRRVPSAGGSQPQQQQLQQKPRSQSTGREALTKPQAPNFRSSYRSKAEKDKPKETSEEVDFRKQQKMQEHLKQMTRRNQIAMERSRRTAYSGNVRSSKPLTVPESPAMKTVGRLGGKVYAAVGSQVDQKGFSPTHPSKDDPHARDHAVPAQPKGSTRVAPFHLSSSSRTATGERGGGGGASIGRPSRREEILTFRESLSRIENKTPDRFRTKPANDHSKPAHQPYVEPKPTQPVSPRFRTEARAMVYPKTKVMTREEREDIELAAMKKHQFKARPYSADGFGVSGEQGIFRPQHSDKQLTQPAPFRLSTDGRASKREPSPHRSCDEEELSKKFKARPMPTGRSSSVGRVRPGANSEPIKPRQATVAASPMLFTKRRSMLRSSSVGGGGVGSGAGKGGEQTSEDIELEQAAAKQFKARPMPNSSRPGSQGQSRRHSAAPCSDQSIALTEPRPFHLRSEERGKAKQALLQQRLMTQRKQEEAAARVRARPLPAPSQGFMPQPSHRPLTEANEFCLSSQARHERAADEFRERIKREEDRARRATQVTALPLPAATFEPEVYPQRTEISVTQPVEVMLHSNARAEGRAAWEQKNQARLEAEKQARVDESEAAAEAEKRSIQAMRRRSHDEGGMAFKARPIKWNAAPPECAQLSTAPLTTPITPNLRTKRRAVIAASRESEPVV